MHNRLSCFLLPFFKNKRRGVHEVGLSAPGQPSVPSRARPLVRRGEKGGQKVRLSRSVHLVVDDRQPHHPRAPYSWSTSVVGCTQGTSFPAQSPQGPGGERGGGGGGGGCSGGGGWRRCGPGRLGVGGSGGGLLS